jgi:hypothetical protein
MYIGGSVDSLTFARNDAGTKADVMSLTRDGNVGIGTTSPGANLHVVRANDGGSGTPGVILSTANGANDIVRFQDGTTTTAVVKNDGSIFAGSSTGVTLNSLTNRLSVSSTTYNLFDISRFSDNAFGPNFYLVKSRNGSIGGNTIVANGDNLGNINWVGANGTGFTDAASIKAEVDGTPGASNDMPGRLVFSTTADEAGSVTERMRITSDGNVGIGTTSPGYRLVVNSATDGISAGIAGSTYGIRFDNGGTFSSGMSTIHGVNSTLIGSYQPIMLNGLDVRFGTSATERMRITSGGSVTINNLSTGAIYSTSGTLTNTAPLITATGGTIVTTGGFKYHTFTSSGTFQVTAGSGLIEVFVLGGGGAGGGDASGATFYAGGGGSGGGLYHPAYYVEVASYTVTVGAGGTPNVLSNGVGGDGNNSVFGNITALGGGGGARGNGDSSSGFVGRDGGSGGGGGSSDSASGISIQSITNGVAYGNNGANGNGIGGGGGGIGTQPGLNGVGGLGKYILNQANRIGGGGGAGSFVNPNNNGRDGGGTGGYWNGSNSSNSSGTAGTANTGGGGGGLGYNVGSGGAGGSGIVIVKYKV